MLKRFREERVQMVRQYVGAHWSEEGTQERVPVNLLALYVSIVARNLVPKDPRVMLSTFNRPLKPMVRAMEAWGNKEIEHMKLANTLQRIVIDALFSVGICKVALATPQDAALFSWNLHAGEPYAERVDLDDFVFDQHARDFTECSFIGHRYRAPKWTVTESKLFKKSQRKDIPASYDPPFNPEGDERLKQLGQQYIAGMDEEFEEMVDLWEIYLPRHRQVITLTDDQLTGAYAPDAEPLRVQRWLGPEAGPYHILAFGVVPGNAMPKAPIQDLFDLHDAANRTMRKVIRMADRVKENVFVAGGAIEDAERLRNASDGEMFRCDRPDSIRQVVTSGQAMNPLVAISTLLKDTFGYMAGNLDMMGGLSPQSKTLGQDQMLSQNASRTITDMQDRTVGFTADVLKALFWYWHHDPMKVQKSLHTLAGVSGIAMTRQVTPQMRAQHAFEDLDIMVDPYSLQHQTPQMRMQAITQLMTQIVIPMGQLMQPQGITVDWNTYLSMAGRYMDMPELAEILTIIDPPAPDVGRSSPDEPPKPGQTQREYIRHNMPGQTREASDRNTITSMLGVNTGGNPNKNGQPQGVGA